MKKNLKIWLIDTPNSEDINDDDYLNELRDYWNELFSSDVFAGHPREIGGRPFDSTAVSLRFREQFEKPRYEITSIADVHDFFSDLITDYGCIPNPDEDFRDITDTDGDFVFGRKWARHLQAVMDSCKEFCEKNHIDIYHHVARIILLVRLQRPFPEDYCFDDECENDSIQALLN